MMQALRRKKPFRISTEIIVFAANCEKCNVLNPTRFAWFEKQGNFPLQWVVGSFLKFRLVKANKIFKENDINPKPTLFVLFILRSSTENN